MISCTSPPEQKFSPAPVRTTALTASLSPSVRNQSRSSRVELERERVLALGPVERNRRDAVGDVVAGLRHRIRNGRSSSYSCRRCCGRSRAGDRGERKSAACRRCRPGKRNARTTLRNVDREQVRAHFQARGVGAGDEGSRPRSPRLTSSDEKRIAEDRRRRVVAFDSAARQRRQRRRRRSLGGIGEHVRRAAADGERARRRERPDANAARLVVVRKAFAAATCSREGARAFARKASAGASARAAKFALDYAVGVCSVWISGGFFLDAWAHGHVPVESFFTPYHAVFYSGMLAGRRHRRDSRLRIARARLRLGRLASAPLPAAAARHPDLHPRGFRRYALASLLGIEEGVDALLSPTHQVLGLGIFFFASGPIRSVLADRGSHEARSASFRWCSA